MSEVFLKVVNMSISASWLVLAVLLLRFVLKKAPKWIDVLLWGVVAIRAICPFSIESTWSLIPSAETVPMNIEMAAEPAINSGMDAIDRVLNPVISTSFAPDPLTSVNPLQIWIPLASILWIFGMMAMLLYAVISGCRLRHKVDTAVRWGDNVFQSEMVSAPFVLGIIKPKIYLPFRLDGQERTYVIAHEQAHIRRKDPWWKLLGFCLLAVHWFNPLMWGSYVLLCRDMELACDETVIRDLSNEQRADYMQALVACSVKRYGVVGSPLAFGEVGVKERVKAVMNYRRPAVWVVALAGAVCIALAVCFLTDPAAKREFPIDGSKVSDLDSKRVAERIADVEGLEDSSQLYVNGDNFDLLLTPEFDWANDGAIRFFYRKNQKTYGAQLRMFHDENKYFITDSEAWTEQGQLYLLTHYLDALKYLPQEEIRQLSPDADGYSVVQVKNGAPGDYERVLQYSADGVEDMDGWYLHLEMQPLHNVGGTYNGTGDEVIHLFYGPPAQEGM